jgi:hypothetical protein
MPMFERFHLGQEEAEARLNRCLTGDPTRGEIALLGALNANRFDDVQARLTHDNSVGSDLRAIVAEQVQKAKARWETRKLWQVSLPLPVWDEYAREARMTGRSVSECPRGSSSTRLRGEARRAAAGGRARGARSRVPFGRERAPRKRPAA